MERGTPEGRQATVPCEGQDLFTDLYQFAPFDRAYTAPDFWPAGASGPPAPPTMNGAARVEALLAEALGSG